MILKKKHELCMFSKGMKTPIFEKKRKDIKHFKDILTRLFNRNKTPPGFYSYKFWQTSKVLSQ